MPEANGARFRLRVPVLLYHHIGPRVPGTVPRLTISPQTFRRHLVWLKRRGFQAIACSDLLRARRKHDISLLPPKPLLLTFDDGYADLAQYAFPLLQHHGFRATVFLVADYLGTANLWDQAAASRLHRLLSAEQCRKAASMGIEFGSHSKSHPDLRTTSPELLESELHDSRAQLEDVLQQPVTVFAYPYGIANDAAVTAARHHYDAAFTCAPLLNTEATDPHLLGRSEVFPTDNILDLRWRMAWGWSPISRFTRKVIRTVAE